MKFCGKEEFSVRTPDPASRNAWIEAIRALKQYYVSIKELPNTINLMIGGKLYRNADLPPNVSNAIQTENEKILIEDGTLKDPNADAPLIFKAKGMSDYFQKLPQEQLSKRICCGWLKKLSTGLDSNLLKSIPSNIYKNYWFFMISTRPIVNLQVLFVINGLLFAFVAF